MPRIRRNETVNKVEEVTPEVVETKVEEVIPEVVETKVEEVAYPEVAGTGRFQHVKFEDGHVVYNPNGQRITGKVDLRTADDTVRAQNLAMGL